MINFSPPPVKALLFVVIYLLCLNFYFKIVPWVFLILPALVVWVVFFCFRMEDNLGGLRCAVGPIPEGLGGLGFSQG